MVEIMNEVSMTPADLVSLYEHALTLRDELGTTQSHRKEDVLQRYRDFSEKISSPEAMFKIFKTICFENEAHYQSIPELTISAEEMRFSDSAKLDSDGSFLFTAKQVPFRLMRGYNSVLKVHFIVIKGLTLYEGYCYPSVQIICQSKSFKGVWVSNSLEVCHFTRANILQQFIGEDTDSYYEFFLCSFDRYQHQNLMALRIFIDAPKIMKIASIILSEKLLPPLANMVIDYYSFEISDSL